MGGGPSSHALSHRGQDVDSTDFFRENSESSEQLCYVFLLKSLLIYCKVFWNFKKYFPY